MKRLFVASALIGTAVLAACGGGSGGSSSTVPAAPKSSGTQVGVTMVIPPLNPPAASSGVRRHYVSGSTKGVKIVVTGAGGASYTTVVDVSGGAACSGSTPRTCTFNVNAPVDTDTFAITSYDQPPVSGAIPGNAKVLSQGSVAQTITGPTGTLTFYLGAVIAGFSSSIPAFVSTGADGTTHTIALLLQAVDAGNNVVSGGTNDPYSTPITVALTEIGGTGHAHLTLNGSNSGTSATVSRSSDTVTVVYDGAGTSGYSIDVTLGASGATSKALQISPMFVSTSSTFVTAHTVSMFGSGSTVTFVPSEAGATPTYTVNYSGCTNIASGSVTNGASPTWTLTGGTTPSSSGCTATISDGTSSINYVITNTLASTSVSLPAASSTAYPLPVPTNDGRPAQPSAIVVGHDGNIWTGTGNGDNVPNVMNLSGTSLGNWDASSGGSTTALVAAPDGTMWFADSSGIVATNGNGNQGTPSHFSATSPINSLAVGPDGNVWFTDTSAMMGAFSITGAVVKGLFPLPSGEADATSLIVGPDGNFWMTAPSENEVNWMKNDGSASHVVSTGAGTTPTQIASGSDGAVWFTLSGTSQVGRIAANGTYAYTTYGTGAVNPGPATFGSDGQFWYCAVNAIGRFNITTHVTNTFAYPTSGATGSGIVAGPDGYLWFTENNVSAVGVLSP